MEHHFLSLPVPGESNIKPFPCHGVILWWKCIFIGPSMVGAEETCDYHIYGITQNWPDPWWCHQMETFSALLALGMGNSPVTGEFPSQWLVARNFQMFSLICAWTNGWVNNQDAGDLRRHRDHYDVTVMTCGFLERTAIVTSNSIVEWNIFMVRVGLGAGWVIQIKYGLPYCVTCPSLSTDPGSLNPGTRRSRVPGWWDPGIRTNTGAGDTVLAKHT